MMKATSGKQLCLLQSMYSANQACCGLIGLNYAQSFIYLSVSASVDLLARQARGSAQQNLSQQIVAELPMVIPDAQLLSRFQQATDPLMSRWISNLRETQTLSELRGLLLPKLMSGQVVVKEKDALVGADLCESHA